MKVPDKVVAQLRVRPGGPADLARRSTAPNADWLGPIGQAQPKDLAEQDLESLKADLEQAQELLYADASWALLIVLQGLDTAGKDGTIKHVMSGVNPQGCEVVSFRQPSAEELSHDFLWRCVKALPDRGRIGIFNRSYYEEVVVCRVHPELLAAERLPSGTEPTNRFWEERYEDINSFERHLVRSGTRVVKLFLHVSKEEQRKRLLHRLDDPRKTWKFSAADLRERAYFDAYQRVYEEAIAKTSTSWAPWYVVPADHKHVLHALVGGIVVSELDQLKLHPPTDTEEHLAEIKQARSTLEAES
jgi:PPK2 family polyphosphate:nucleotide phosphotransferase